MADMGGGLPVPAKPSFDSGDTAWMLTASTLVLLMTLPGLTLFYGGLVRAKNVLSMFNNIFASAACVTVLWMLWGFSIAFSTTDMAKGAYNLHSVYGSLAHGALRGVGTHRLVGGATYPLSVQVVYQLTFAIITVGLVTGAYAERMRYSAVLLFSALWLATVYCPLAHMVWSGDGALLHDFGALDFAGGLVVHISSGTAGLVTALCIGKRAAYLRIPHAPHSLVLSHVGACLLWVGWFGFNAGSAGAASFAAGQAMLVTHTASAAGALAWSSVEWLSFGRPSTLGLISGAVAGLVGITPASGSVGMLGALCIGGVTGVATFFASTRLKEAIDVYDDALDAFGVHAVGGITGALLTGVWCAPGLGGLGFGKLVHKGGRETRIDNIGFQLGVQAASVTFAICWVVVGTLLVLKITDLVHGGLHFGLRLRAIRVSPELEATGLDEGQFKESGYNLQSSDMRISVEVGPLRGRRGHGLQLYAIDDSGSRHAISLHPGNVEAHDVLAEKLLSEGGVVDLVGSFHAPHAIRTKDVSVHGSDDAGKALRASDVEMGTSVRRGFAAAEAVAE